MEFPERNASSSSSKQQQRARQSGTKSVRAPHQDGDVAVKDVQTLYGIGGQATAAVQVQEKTVATLARRVEAEETKARAGDEMARKG